MQRKKVVLRTGFGRISHMFPHERRLIIGKGNRISFRPDSHLNWATKNLMETDKIFSVERQN